MGSMGFAWKVAWLAWAFILIRVIAALAAAAPPGARATHSDSPSPAELRALDHLLERSGLKGQLETLSASVRAQFLRGQLRDQDRITIDRIVLAHFNAEALCARMALELAHDVDAAKLTEALAWYDSPLGRRVTAVELAAARFAGEHDASVSPETASPGRVALVERLDAGLGASETTVDITVAVVRSLVEALQPSLPALANLSRSQLDEQLAVARNRTLTVFKPAYIAGMLVAYQSLSDAELAAYLRFVESEVGRWYTSQTNRALLRAVDVAARATAAELAPALPPLAAELR
jgi:hypothetical protein